MNICSSISIAQYGEIIIIINSSHWSQNLSPRVRVQRVKSPQSPLQLLQLTYYRIYRLLVLFFSNESFPKTEP